MGSRAESPVVVSRENSWERRFHCERAGEMHGSAVLVVIMGNEAWELFSSIDFLLISGVYFSLLASVC